MRRKFEILQTKCHSNFFVNMNLFTKKLNSKKISNLISIRDVCLSASRILHSPGRSHLLWGIDLRGSCLAPLPVPASLCQAA
jgi:hypothetical protein